MKDIWHEFEAKIEHSDWDEMSVRIERNRQDDGTNIEISIPDSNGADGKNSRVSVTHEELLKIVKMAAQYEENHQKMKETTDETDL